jgi:hypothetical protein
MLVEKDLLTNSELLSKSIRKLQTLIETQGNFEHFNIAMAFSAKTLLAVEQFQV